MNHTKLSYLSCFFIIIFSGYYLTSLKISPIYFLLPIGFLLATIFILFKKNIKISNLNIYILITIMYILISQCAVQGSIPVLLNIILSLTTCFILNIILPHLQTNSIISISKQMIFISLPLLVLESAIRLNNPFNIEFYKNLGREYVFYAYKFNSIMYMDSNFVAVYVLCLYFFWIYLRSYQQKKIISYTTFILFLLIIATLSRANIIAMILFTLLYPLRYLFYQYRLATLISLILAIPIFFFLQNYVAQFDDSFLSKFHIIDLTKEYLQHATITELLIGVGFGNSDTVLGIGAHNFFIIYLVESGIVGLALIVNLLYLILKKSRYKAGIVVFPFLLSGLSFSPTATPYLYAIFSLIITLEARKSPQ